MNTNNLIKYISENDLENSFKETQKLIENKTQLKDILNAIMNGLDIVGKRYKSGDYFIADLIVAGMNVKEIFRELSVDEAYGANSPYRGSVVIGTIYEDIHDIGKDLVADSLKAYGYKIIDLGVDVPVETFMEAIRKYSPDIVAISCVMTSSMKHIIRLCDIISSTNNIKKPKIVVGGSEITKELQNICDADFLTNDLFEGLDFIMGKETND